jgi:hypothetical protein
MKIQCFIVFSFFFFDMVSCMENPTEKEGNPNQDSYLTVQYHRKPESYFELRRLKQSCNRITQGCSIALKMQEELTQSQKNASQLIELISKGNYYQLAYMLLTINPNIKDHCGTIHFMKRLAVVKVLL